MMPDTSSERAVTNPYIGMLPGQANVHITHAYAYAYLAWLWEVQQWQLAAWHQVALVSISLIGLSWEPLPPQPLTVAERMAALSMKVVAGGRD
jgi:hypothetical protein